MGEAELDMGTGRLIIHSHIITYGNSADEAMTERLRTEIETMWNEPAGRVMIQGKSYTVHFSITAQCEKELDQMEVLGNDNPRNNYFRIEAYVQGNISFVDEIGCNTGYFLLDNLYSGSTTAAHEYGHTMGLVHPVHLDIRGRGRPGIMYPRGTWVDAPFQYNPAARAGDSSNGGTMHPMHRKVLPEDIDNLALHRLYFKKGKAIVGDFTNVFHWPHEE